MPRKPPASDSIMTPLSAAPFDGRLEGEADADAGQDRARHEEAVVAPDHEDRQQARGR